MWTRVRMALFLALTFPAASACAEPRSSDTAPKFSVEEHVVIHRNEALEALVHHDPSLVRRALDAITGSPREAPLQPSDRTAKRSKPEHPPDPAHNPDLDQFGRSSPEAAHDLFQLIKKAAAGGKGTSQR